MSLYCIPNCYNMISTLRSEDLADFLQQLVEFNDLENMSLNEFINWMKYSDEYDDEEEDDWLYETMYNYKVEITD